MNQPRVRFIVYRYQHHSPHSGYSRLAEYGLARFDAQIVRVAKPLPRWLIRERILWRLAKGTPGYDRAAMAAEMHVAWKMLREKDAIFHFLYGETNYHYAGYLNDFRNNRLIATFHQPIRGIQKAVQIDWHIRQLSAVICVGSSQANYFDGLLASDRIFVVPLGVDIEYYLPPAAPSQRNPDLCLVVGQNYRDFPTLRGVIELVAYLRPQTKFIAVMSHQAQDLLGNHPNLTLLSNIDETELLNLYHRASLLVMPFTEATANNAILESMACGLPLVVSDIGSIRDYVDSASALIVPPFDARCMAEAVIELLDEQDEREQRSIACRVRAMNFSWDIVLNQLETVYAEIN